VLWASPGFASRMRIDMKCIAKKKDRELSHDHVMHSVLGMLDVEVSSKKLELDLFSGC